MAQVSLLFCHCQVYIMSGLNLLLVSAAPLRKKPILTVGSKPLACRHMSGSTNAATLLLCTPMSLSPAITLTSANKH